MHMTTPFMVESIQFMLSTSHQVTIIIGHIDLLCQHAKSVWTWEKRTPQTCVTWSTRCLRNKLQFFFLMMRLDLNITISLWIFIIHKQIISLCMTLWCTTTCILNVVAHPYSTRQTPHSLGSNIFFLLFFCFFFLAQTF